MKFNWGTGITIALTLFGIFIFYWVFRAVNEKVDLVSDNYYEEEIIYQQRIDQIEFTKELGRVNVSQEGAQVFISFPETILDKSFSGKIHIYKPDDASMDFEVPIVFESEESVVVIPRNKFSRGNYVFKIHLTVDGKKAYWEKKYYL